MREKTIYECEHCIKKRLVNKGSMKKHEKKCWWNIENKTCVTCGYDSGYFDSQGINYPFRECRKGITFNSSRPKVNCPLWKSEDEVYGEEADS